MKKILFALIVCFPCAALHAQTLDYSNYHVVFQDDFKCYANPSGPFPTSDFSTNPSSPYDSLFHANWSTCIPGISNTLYSPANVTMPSYGVIKITEDSLSAYSTTDCNGTTPITVDHTTGALVSNQSFAYGIIEASIQISNDNNPHGIPSPPYVPAGTAFWMGPLPFRGQETEIDIIDASEDNFIIQRLLDWYAPNTTSGISFSEGNIDNNLSSTFHLYSCVWSPSGTRYYLDGNLLHEIDYLLVRSYPGFYPISIDLGVKSITTGGFSMYINNVKVWRQNCIGSDLNVADISVYGPGTGGSDLALYPYSGLYKYNTITSNYTTDYQSVIASNNAPFIFEAGATTIYPNFIADESTLQHSTVTLGSDGGFASSPTTEVTQISNGYFEILPADCSIDNSDTPPPPDCSGNNNQSWYRIQDPNNDSSLNIGNTLPDPTKIQVYPNPARDNVTITYPCNSDSQLIISIKDVAGRVMYSRNVICNEGGGEQTVDVSAFAAGIYFVDIAVSGQHVVKKIVKL